MSEIEIVASSEISHDDCRRLILSNEPWITLGYGQAEVDSIVRSVATSTLLLARSGDTVVGFALSGDGFLRGEYLKILAVDRGVQRQGVGRLLMSALEERAFRSVPNVYLCVSDFNQSARAFYRRLGYGEVGVLDDLLLPGKGEVLMRKSIGSWRTFAATAS